MIFVLGNYRIFFKILSKKNSFVQTETHRQDFLLDCVHASFKALVRAVWSAWSPVCSNGSNCPLAVDRFTRKSLESLVYLHTRTHTRACSSRGRCPRSPPGLHHEGKYLFPTVPRGKQSYYLYIGFDGSGSSPRESSRFGTTIPSEHSLVPDSGRHL